VKVAFLGTGDIGVPALRALAGCGACRVVAAVTQPDRPAGRSMKLRGSAVKTAALELGLPVLQPERVRTAEAQAGLAALEADLFVVAAYGQILPRAVLDMPRLGCINLHASLLPRHRGASPVHAAILAGDNVSGVTVMWVDEGLDTGDILLARPCPVDASDTAGSLHDRIAGLAAEAVLESVGLIADGRAPRIPQDASLATYAPKISKAEGKIDWYQSAAEIERRIRGLHPWPGTFTRLPDGRLLKLHRAILRPDSPGRGEPGCAREENGAIIVATGDGEIALLDVQIEGGKRMDAAGFLRGHPLPPPCRLG